ncbi:YceD family protein [Pontibacter chitinilyticus]|uniref:YceD family protein n=1 Tax=Pontibacter chitinilyticus TaxID=2674989 RepID=UPI0032198AE9
MKKLRDYEIGIANLSNKTHQFEFELNNEFFDYFGGEIIHGGKLVANVTLDKTETLLTFYFDIKGHVQLTCDRSLEEFEHPVAIQQVFRVRFGPEEAELDDDLWQITFDAQTINIAQHLYDYIVLSLPMKKLHPRFAAEQEEEDEDENDILIYSSQQQGDDADEDDGDDNNDIDPRWDALRNLN